MVYQAALRNEVHARLGVTFAEANDHGQVEIRGVPAELLKLWSKRTERIHEEALPKIAEYENLLGRTLGRRQGSGYNPLAAQQAGHNPTLDPRIRPVVPDGLCSAERHSSPLSACARWKRYVLGQEGGSTADLVSESAGCTVDHDVSCFSAPRYYVSAGGAPPQHRETQFWSACKHARGRRADAVGR